MKVPESREQLPNQAAGYVCGEPYQTPDGTRIITVTRGDHHRHPGGSSPSPGGIITVTRGRGRGFAAAPVGVFVVDANRARWLPAFDPHPVALIGVLTGLLSAVIAALAVLRRPPWPDLRR